jgi:hypothetical protein
MARVSLSPSFLKDTLSVFRQRGIKGLLFGKNASINSSELEFIQSVVAAPHKFDARVATLQKIDVVHAGKGTVFLCPDPNNSNQSLLVFDEQTKITNGPDLWLYLSDSEDPKKSFASYIDLGLLHGNKGAQLYVVPKPIAELAGYKSVIVYCKQFDILFSYGLLV